MIFFCILPRLNICSLRLPPSENVYIALLSLLIDQLPTVFIYLW